MSLKQKIYQLLEETLPAAILVLAFSKESKKDKRLMNYCPHCGKSIGND